MTILSGHQVTLIAGRAVVSISTVERFYRGDHRGHTTTWTRICTAARELGLPPPPQLRIADYRARFGARAAAISSTPKPVD